MPSILIYRSTPVLRRIFFPSAIALRRWLGQMTVTLTLFAGAVASGNASAAGCGFNVDALGGSGPNGTADLTSDGLLILRYALGFTGSALIAGTRADQTPSNLATVVGAINAHMTTYSAAHDIDGSGGTISVKDATIIARYLSGFRGASLTSGLSLAGGTRITSQDIDAYIGTGCDSSNTSVAQLIFVHSDSKGSPLMATDTNGNPLWREDYSAFGERKKNENR